MRAAVLNEVGGIPEYGEFEDPAGHGDGALVEIAVAGLNPVDIATTSGLMGPVEVPCVAGLEGIGTHDGRRVYFEKCLPPFGSFAERTRVDPELLIDVPDGVDAELAVCFGTAGLAAWNALEWRGRLAVGESVLVLGASSVVGQIAVQAAKLLGAGRVTAAARDEEMLVRTRELGADATVDIGGEPDEIAARLAEAAGQGYDVILDAVWGEPAVAALPTLADHGRLVQVGNAASPTASISPRGLRAKLASILFFTIYQLPPDVKAQSFQRMCEHGARGELRVDVEVVPLAEVASAWERQGTGPHRKLVIRP
jgi:NADPH2:quinone reductase